MAMSPEHKAVLAKGRVEARAIKAYLSAIGSRPRGRPVTREVLEKRIADLEGRIEQEEDPLKSVRLRQERIDNERALASFNSVDLDSLEAGFVENAASYSDRNGISYSAWREAGVPASVLRAAGIARGGGSASR